MTAEAAPAIAAGPGRHCRTVTATVLSAVELLVSESAHDGQISVDQVRRIIRHLGKPNSSLDRTFLHQEKQCRAIFRRPHSETAARRSEHYRRLAVRPIEPLLAGDEPAFPRRFLTNYFMIVDQALDAKLDHFKTQTEAVYQDLLIKHGTDAVWDEFFIDRRSGRLLAYALRRITSYLESPAGQWMWLKAMSQPTAEGAAPTTEQTEQVRTAIHAAWDGMQAAQAVHG